MYVPWAKKNGELIRVDITGLQHIIWKMYLPLER